MLYVYTHYIHDPTRINHVHDSIHIRKACSSAAIMQSLMTMLSRVRMSTGHRQAAEVRWARHTSLQNCLPGPCTDMAVQSFIRSLIVAQFPAGNTTAGEDTSAAQQCVLSVSGLYHSIIQLLYHVFNYD